MFCQLLSMIFVAIKIITSIFCWDKTQIMLYLTMLVMVTNTMTDTYQTIFQVKYAWFMNNLHTVHHRYATFSQKSHFLQNLVTTILCPHRFHDEQSSLELFSKNIPTQHVCLLLGEIFHCRVSLQRQTKPRTILVLEQMDAYHATVCVAAIQVSISPLLIIVLN